MRKKKSCCMSKTVFVTPKSLNDSASYWAMFYCAILKTILYQKNLPYALKGSSLQSYRGELEHPSNFFNSMKASVRNHAFEYLMMDFLRSNDGKGIRAKLIDELLARFGIHGFKYKLINVFKLGGDSTLYAEISDYDNPKVTVFVPNSTVEFEADKEHNDLIFIFPVDQIATKFRYSDLLIMISDGERTFGFVGEVEGLHGEKLFQPAYWNQKEGIKSKFTSFALGASDRKKVSDVIAKENVVLTTDESGRVIINFSNRNEFIKSYDQALNNIELCLDGHYKKINSTDESHEKIIKIITSGWKKSIPDVISNLEELIDYDVDIDEFSYQDYDEHNEIVYKPSPIVQLNKFHLHKISE